VVLSRSGRLTPLYRVLGPANLELQAMNAVRLWKCKPYTTAGSPLDVLTEVQVKFVPGQPAGFLTHGSE
jgi:hypothetical protein